MIGLLIFHIVCVNIVKVKMVQIVTPSNNSKVNVFLGEKTNLQCITKGSRPQARIEWFLNGLDITGSSAVITNYSGINVAGEKMVTASFFTLNSGIGNATIFCKAHNIDQTVFVQSTEVIAIFVAPVTQVMIQTPNKIFGIFVTQEAFNEQQCQFSTFLNSVIAATGGALCICILNLYLSKRRKNLCIGRCCYKDSSQNNSNCYNVVITNGLNNRHIYLEIGENQQNYNYSEIPNNIISENNNRHIYLELVALHEETENTTVKELVQT